MNSQTWSAGLNYGQGPWSLGAQYSMADTELAGADLGSLGIWTIGGKYDLGPGVTAFGGVQLHDDTNEDGDSNKSQVFFVGTSLSF